MVVIQGPWTTFNHEPVRCLRDRLAFDRTAAAQQTARAWHGWMTDSSSIRSFMFRVRAGLGAICPVDTGLMRPSIIATTAGQRLASGGPRIFETFAAQSSVSLHFIDSSIIRAHTSLQPVVKRAPGFTPMPISWRTEDQDQRSRGTKFAPIRRASSRVPMQAGGAAEEVIGSVVLLARSMNERMN